MNEHIKSALIVMTILLLIPIVNAINAGKIDAKVLCINSDCRTVWPSGTGTDENHTGIAPITFDNLNNLMGLNVTSTTDWNGTFDGQQGSYYLDYTNLTNKPTFPLVDANVSDDITLNWTNLTTYPSACGAGEFVSAVGDTLTCSIPSESSIEQYTAGGNLILDIVDNNKFHFNDANFFSNKHTATNDWNFSNLQATAIFGNFYGTAGNYWNKQELTFSLVDGNVSDDITINWINLTTYPSACGAGEFVSAVGDTLTCSTPAGTGITDTNTVTAGYTNNTGKWIIDLNASRINGTDINFENRLWNNATSYSGTDLNAWPGSRCAGDANSIWTSANSCLNATGLNIDTKYTAGGNLTLVGTVFHFSDVNFTGFANTWNGTQTFTKTIQTGDQNNFTGKANIQDLNIGSGNLKVNSTTYSIANDLNKFIPYSDLNSNFVRKGTTIEQNMDANLLLDFGNGAIKAVPDQNMIQGGNNPAQRWCIYTVDQNVVIGFC